MITAIRHTGIVVRDIVAMRRFYIALGFQLNQTATESGQFIEQVTGVEKAKINWVKLRAADGNLLELLEYDGHDPKSFSPKTKFRRARCLAHRIFGIRHTKVFRISYR